MEAVNPESGEVRVSVAASGIGIPEDERLKVFEPFYRASAAKKSTIVGSGLGLAFVKTVAEASGGRASVEVSDLGGAEVVMEIPLVDPEVLIKPDGPPPIIATWVCRSLMR